MENPKPDPQATRERGELIERWAIIIYPSEDNDESSKGFRLTDLIQKEGEEEQRHLTHCDIQFNFPFIRLGFRGRIYNLSLDQ